MELFDEGGDAVGITELFDEGGDAVGITELFDEGGDAVDITELFDEGGDEDVSKIEINHEFAKLYEHNKKREDLQRYKELKKRGGFDSSDSDSEDSPSEEEELVKSSKKTDYEFFDALVKVKNQDSALRNKDTKLFNSDSEEQDDGGSESEKSETKRKKKKPMYLKDVVSKHLIEASPEFNDEETESRVKSYSEEQEELRREFLKAVEEGENDEKGELLRVKSSGGKDGEEEDEFGGKLDEYFGEDEKLDADMMFLKDYFRNRMWVEDERSKEERDQEVEFSEDEEEIERQEDYERGYNFRYEENVVDRVMGHSRKVEGSVRKKENARKLQRERKEERTAQAETERKEELKRLKNLKKQEINEKLEKIREVAGIGEDGGVFMNEDDLEEEFDPEEYDRKTKEAFGGNYYGAEDADPEFRSDQDEDGFGFEKPDFDKEDELLGLPKGWDEVKESGGGFMSARQRILGNGVADGDGNESDEDKDGEPKSSKRKRKRKPSEVEKAVREQLMEEYYKLDYEDTIGDLRTRFKYKPVKAKRYGLTPEEILKMEDKELNQYVSLKKIAPYREKEWKVPRIKTIQLKQRAKNFHDGETSVSIKEGRNETQHGSKAMSKVVNAVETEGAEPAELSGDKSTLSRRSKRRRRQAELKLSRSRLMAYGKISSKSEIKNKQ